MEQLGIRGSAHSVTSPTWLGRSWAGLGTPAVCPGNVRFWVICYSIYCLCDLHSPRDSSSEKLGLQPPCKEVAVWLSPSHTGNVERTPCARHHSGQDLWAWGQGLLSLSCPLSFFFVIHRMVRSCEGRALSEASLVSSAGGGTWNMFSNIFWATEPKAEGWRFSVISCRPFLLLAVLPWWLCLPQSPSVWPGRTGGHWTVLLLCLQLPVWP